MWNGKENKQTTTRMEIENIEEKITNENDMLKILKKFVEEQTTSNKGRKNTGI